MNAHPVNLESRLPWAGIVFAILVLIVFVVFTAFHLGEAEQFLALLERARPEWLVLAIFLQLGTYACTGAIWHSVAVWAGYPLRVLESARLAVEKLSVDQLMPTAGMAGNLVVVEAMRRLGLPASVAAEALLVELLAYSAAYALTAALVFFFLWGHGADRAFLMLLVLFSLSVGTGHLGLRWLVAHRDWKPGPRLENVVWLSRLRKTLAEVSEVRVLDPRLFGLAFSFQLGVFGFDSATLWTLMMALGMWVSPLACFVAIVMASVARSLSFLPGGIGTYEAGCTATLALLGIPVEAALTGTLLFRGLSLWIPLAPGAWLARRDLASEVQSR